MAQTKVQLLQPDLGDVIDFDAGTLYVDSSDNRIGIGTTDPSTKLVISNAGAEGLEVHHASGTVEVNAYKRSDTSRSPFEITAQTFKLSTGNPSLTAGLHQDASGHVIIGADTYGAAGSFSVASHGSFRQTLASGASQDTLIGAISGVSNGFQINTDGSNNQTYTFHNGSNESSIKLNALVCFPSPHTSISPSDNIAFLHIAAGAFSFPPSQVPSTPNIL